MVDKTYPVHNKETAIDAITTYVGQINSPDVKKNLPAMCAIFSMALETALEQPEYVAGLMYCFGRDHGARDASQIWAEMFPIQIMEVEDGR